MRPIGVSIISFFPMFFMPGGYNKIEAMLGGLGIQLLPLRGLNQGQVRMFNVLSYEGPWNCGKLTDAIKRQMGIRRGYPSLIDIALFGSEQRCRNSVEMLAQLCPGALAIDTPWVKDSVIELSPDMYGGNARQWDRQPNGVVLDTYHWQRFKQHEAERELEKLGGLSAVRMVHLKLMSKAQTHSFLGNNSDINSTLLREFTSHDRAGNIPIIIEAKHDSLGDSKKDILARLADRIKEVLS